MKVDQLGLGNWVRFEWGRCSVFVCWGGTGLTYANVRSVLYEVMCTNNKKKFLML